MILILDNYDSFTFNLYQMIEELGFPCSVVRNDVMTVAELQSMNPTHLIISPGPGRPEEAGVTLEAIKTFSGKIPILGVCLGHQAIALSFGGKVVLAPRAFHGKCSKLTHNKKDLFFGLSPEINVARYHSLMVTDLPHCLETTSSTRDGVVMGIRHKELNISGVQFHPESFATENGREIIANFLKEAV